MYWSITVIFTMKYLEKSDVIFKLLETVNGLQKNQKKPPEGTVTTSLNPQDFSQHLRRTFPEKESIQQFLFRTYMTEDLKPLII